MKKYYSEPELEIRKYEFVEGSVLTASQPETDTDNNLNDDDEYDIFGK